MINLNGFSLEHLDLCLGGALGSSRGGGGNKYASEPLTFEAVEDGTFSFTRQVDYTIDGTIFSKLPANTPTQTITAGTKVMWHGFGVNKGSMGTFSSTGQFKVSGNVMSLLYVDFLIADSLGGMDEIFKGLFNSCTNLLDAKDLVLPATTLATSCYSELFKDCSSLTTAPKLPATALVTSCYQAMFQGCSSLTTAPDLLADQLVGNCYSYMFNGCTSLNYIKCLATEIGKTPTVSWVDGVAATGTFVRDGSSLIWSLGVDGIPSGWTVIDV